VVFTHEVALPLLTELGTRWRDGDLRPTHEHVGSVAMRRVLDWLLDFLATGPGAPRLVCATPAGERHEFGAMLAAVIAETSGWNTTYVGPDLPADDIAAAARITGADCVALSAIGRSSARTLRPEILRLRQALPPNVPLILGGHTAQRLVDTRGIDVVVLDDLRSFADWLRANSPAVTAARAGQ